MLVLCMQQDIEKDARVTTNSLGLAQVCLVDTVNLGDLDVFGLESGGRLLVFGSESLAVPTPGGD